MLPRAQFHLQVGEPGPGRPVALLVRVVVLVGEDDLFWANSAFVFAQMKAVVETQWRQILAMSIAPKRKQSESIAFSVPGVCKLQCNLAEAEFEQSVLVLNPNGGATVSQQCSHEIIVRLMPPLTS